MSPLKTKRPRGRPPKDPAKRGAYRRATIKLTKSGRQVKSRSTVKDSYLEAWLEANEGNYWKGRGRPPKNATPLSEAVQTTFGITVRTYERALRRINARRHRMNSVRLDPLHEVIAQAMAGSYRKPTSTNHLNPTSKINDSLSLAIKEVATISDHREPSILEPLIADSHLRSTFLEALASSNELDFLRSIQRLLDSKIPRTTTQNGPSSNRPINGLESVGLFAAPPKQPTKPISKPADQGLILTEILIESLDCWLSHFQSHPLQAIGEQLRNNLLSPSSR